MTIKDAVKLHILESIRELGEFTWINKISEHCNVCSATVSKYVDILEKEGKVTVKWMGNTKTVMLKEGIRE